MTTIYGLIDPRTREIRYVGKTKKTPEARLAGHIFVAERGGRAQRFIWIRSLLRDGVRPELVVLDVVPDDDWRAAEAAWIAYLQDECGARLVNNTRGGDGTHGCVREPWSDDAKQKQSVRAAAAYNDPEVRRRVSEGTREGMRRWREERPDEYEAAIERWREAMREIFASQEYRDKISAASKRHWADPEARRKHSERMKQVTYTKVKCPGCDMVSRAGNITRHRRARGH